MTRSVEVLDFCIDGKPRPVSGSGLSSAIRGTSGFLCTNDDFVGRRDLPNDVVATIPKRLVRLLIWCKACRHKPRDEFSNLVEQGKGDAPVVHLKIRCTNCRYAPDRLRGERQALGSEEDRLNMALGERRLTL